MMIGNIYDPFEGLQTGWNVQFDKPYIDREALYETTVEDKVRRQ